MTGTALTGQPPISARRLISALVITMLLCLSVQAGATSASVATSRFVSATSEFVDVIVQGFSGSELAAGAVESVGGEVTKDLWIIDGVGARVPADSLDFLRNSQGIRQVSGDWAVTFHGRFNGTGSARIQKVVRSDKLWNEGIDGSGVTVAVLDTGIYAAHPDLQGPNGSRVIHCEDLSFERDTEAHCADSFGHGTFMAGLIAGNGASSFGYYKGAAPKANLVAIKVAGYDGSTDVSNILSGVQWAVSFKDTYNISVLNLSLGTDSGQDYRLSPMNYAVERAWDAGIVVNVSSGNSGPDASTVMKPGDDPFVVTVGASNDQGTNSINDDRIASFSSRGPTRANNFAKPDIVSPGVHTVSLVSPGSAIDDQFGASGSRIGNHYFKGTGTSMSTATVSGVVAQMLEANPGLTNDQVKHRLLDTARTIATTDPYAVGEGLVDAYAAAHSNSTASANQGIDRSSGLGSLELDRGTLGVEVATPLGSFALIGEFKAQTDPSYVSLSNPRGLVPWVGTNWRAEAWDGTNWRVEDWAGTNWRGTNWRATVWDGTNWRGTNWRNEDWEGTNWRNEDWDGTNWRASSWQSAWYAAQWD